MTIAEVFKPDGNAVNMIDTMYDLLIGARIPFGVAELQDGRQLFVLGNGGAPVRQEDVGYELLAYLSRQSLSPAQLADEIQQAVIDVI